MKQDQHLSMRQGNEQRTSKSTKGKAQHGETIDNCTLDPCPMKTESQLVECPECGKTDVPDEGRKTKVKR